MVSAQTSIVRGVGFNSFTDKKVQMHTWSEIAVGVARLVDAELSTRWAIVRSLFTSQALAHDKSQPSPC